MGIGLAVMMASFMILEGFKQTIADKIYSFSGHLQVSKYVLNNSLLEEPLSAQADFYIHPEDYPYIKHVQRVAYKGGLIKTDQDVQGVLLKGVDNHYDNVRFAKYITEGRFIHFQDSAYSQEVVVSRKMAQLLRLETGEDITMFFIQNPPRFRRLQIVGIYETGLEDFDDKVIVGDLGLIQRLNNWGDTLVGGYEVFIHRPSQVVEAEYDLFERADADMLVQKVSDKYIQIFDWLYLLNRNVIIFLGLILFVACFNMISIVFILIMERTRMIGLLKSLGANNRLIRKIFIYTGLTLVGKGLLFGNLIALGFGALQYYFNIIPLDPENYYMNYVPISWNWPVFMALNLLILVVVGLILFLPTFLISRLSPVKSMKFD